VRDGGDGAGADVDEPRNDGSDHEACLSSRMVISV
jgi:hypothetical protein